MSPSVAKMTSAPTCQMLLGRTTASEILASVRAQVDELARAGRPPRLVSVTFGASQSAKVYVRNQKRIAGEAGIAFAEVTLTADITAEAALTEIARLNADASVTGIILQRPIPAHLSTKSLQGAIHPLKDVEGMHPTSIGKIVYGLSGIGPCTAIAAVELLKRTGLKLPGLEVVVIGHSEIVGKPIAFLLMAEGATVTVCHHMTRSVAMHARRADAVFVAVGKPQLVGAAMIKPGAAVIDIGINVVDDGTGKSRVVGDVDFEAVQHVAGWLTPVPAGVGPVTLAVLMRNTVLAAQSQARMAPVRMHQDLDRVIIRDIEVQALVGIHPHEQKQLQPVRINIEIEAMRGGSGIGVLCYESLAGKIRGYFQDRHTMLVEEVAEEIAQICLDDPRAASVTVRVEKPEAIKGAASAGVEITRRNHAMVFSDDMI